MFTQTSEMKLYKATLTHLLIQCKTSSKQVQFKNKVLHGYCITGKCDILTALFMLYEQYIIFATGVQCIGPGVCGCSVTCEYGTCWNGVCECWEGYRGDTCNVLDTSM